MKRTDIRCKMTGNGMTYQLWADTLGVGVCDHHVATFRTMIQAWVAQDRIERAA